MSKKIPQLNQAIEVESFDSFTVANGNFYFQIVILKINRSNIFPSFLKEIYGFCLSLFLIAGISGVEEIIFFTWIVYVRCFWQHLLWLPWIRRALHISPSFCCRRGMV